MNLDVDDLIANVYPVLHATSETDVVFTDDDELTRLFSNAVKRLADTYGVFVIRDNVFITLATGQATYNLPPRHLSTLHVSLSNRPLIADSRTSLERRDTAYETTPATVARPVRRFYEDKHGFNKIGFHPVPSAASGNGLKPEVIYHRYPCEVEDGIETPKVIGDYLEVQVIGESYNKESDFQIVEVAQSCKTLAALYEQMIGELWSVSQ